MTSTKPVFSVIIPAYVRPEKISLCLDRIAPGAQTYPADKYEVIVTDDSPNNTIRDLVKRRFSWVQWTAGPRRGPASNRNHGASAAQGEWLAFTDDDCLPELGWLSAFAATMEKMDALEGRTYADRPRQSLGEFAPENKNGGFWWSCNIAVRKEFFQQLGGFDEGFPFASMEDVDFAQRMKEAHARQKFVPQAGVCHPWRDIGGFRGMWNTQAKHFFSVKYFLRLHPEAHINYTSWLFLKNNVRTLLRNTLPGLCRFHGRGADAALAWHLHCTLNALVMMKSKSKLTS